MDDPSANEIKYDGACPLCHGDMRICMEYTDGHCPLRAFRWNLPDDWVPIEGKAPSSGVTTNPAYLGNIADD